MAVLLRSMRWSMIFKWQISQNSFQTRLVQSRPQAYEEQGMYHWEAWSKRKDRPKKRKEIMWPVLLFVPKKRHHLRGLLLFLIFFLKFLRRARPEKAWHIAFVVSAFPAPSESPLPPEDGNYYSFWWCPSCTCCYQSIYLFWIVILPP